MELVVFLIAGALAIIGALGLIGFRNPVHSALSLVLSLFAVAILFLNQDAQFLAAVQVIVYAGAIVVLFLFVIMLLGVDQAEDLSVEPITGQRPIALAIGAAVLVLSVLFISVAADGGATGQESVTATKVDSITTTTQSATDALADDQTDGTEALPNIEQLGRSLFTDYVFAFEVTALLLTIAVVGAVLLARKPKGELAPMPEIPVPVYQRRCVFTRRDRRDGGRLMELTSTWYLVLAAILFALGATGLLVRRNPLIMFMCVELMLNAVNLTFVTFGNDLNDLGGEISVFFVLVVAAAEVVVGLAIIVAIMRRRNEATADDLSVLRG